jgi:predicted nucleotidyltransferase
MLEKLLGSRLRAKALGWLYCHPGERFFVRQLTGLLREDSTNLSRELARLAQWGVLTCQQEGRQKYYQANPTCPVFPELKSLAIKTAGLGDVIRSALKPVASRIRLALVFGSFASGHETAASDIDLLLAGNLSLREVASLLGPMQKDIGRNINCVVYRPAELRQKAKAGHHFVTSVLNNPKMFLIGDEGDLARVVG